MSYVLLHSDTVCPGSTLQGVVCIDGAQGAMAVVAQVIGKMLVDTQHISRACLPALPPVPGGSRRWRWSQFLSAQSDRSYHTSFHFSVLLPLMLPPSYYGRAVKFVYLVAVQVVGATSGGTIHNSETKAFFQVVPNHVCDKQSTLSAVTTCPLRCVLLSSTNKTPLRHKRVPSTVEPESPPPQPGPCALPHVITPHLTATPQQARPDSDELEIDIARCLSAIRSGCRSRSRRARVMADLAFDITQARTASDLPPLHVAMVFVPRTMLYPGSSLCVRIDWETSEVPCSRVTACLLSKEVLASPCTDQGARELVHAQAHRFCAHASSLRLNLAVPSNAVPGFNVPAIVALEWIVRVKFITCAQHALVWQLPVKVGAVELPVHRPVFKALKSHR